MKCRIWKKYTVWTAFNAPNPLLWRLDIPAGLILVKDHLPVSTDFATFEQAVRAFQYLLNMKKRGWLHR